MRYRVEADDPNYTQAFSTYAEAFTWLRMVRSTFGCNAGLVEMKE
jgi:hypothetical protein